MDKVCVVTGATGGIGVATVKEMAQHYKVLFSDVNQARLDALAAELTAQGRDVEGMVCDVSDRAQCDALARRAAVMGKVVGVIHLAGLTPTKNTASDIIRVDCLGTININEAFYQVMDGGCIMDICSCVAHFIPQDKYPTQIFDLALTDRAQFHKSMVEMIQSVSTEASAPGRAYTFGRCFVYWYARKCNMPFGRNKGIRIVTVSIGFVETPMSKADLEVSGQTYEQRVGPMVSYNAFARPGTPEEVAFLFSTIVDERNSFLTGCDIYFDAGSDANGYHGQSAPYDPASNSYDPAASV